MRVLAIILLLSLTSAADAQTSNPAKPDARLGAGGVSRSAGNVVYPGAPTRASLGSIPGPGLPIIQTTSKPSAPKPAPPAANPPPLPDPSPVVYVPFYVPVYGIEAGSTLITAPSSLGESRAEHELEEAPKGDRVVSARRDDAPADYGLIALHGGLIYAASRYRVEGQTLRFLTVQGDRYVVALNEVDLEFSKRLNRDRGSEFSLD